MKNGLFIDEFGNKRYYLNNLFHREDGPAIEYANGRKVWYQHGQLHREDGPAVEELYGERSWYFHDEYISCHTQEQFLIIIHPELTSFL
jgi:hypothetical protein